MASPNALVITGEPPLFSHDEASAQTLPNVVDIAAALVASYRWILGSVLVLTLAGVGVYKLQAPVYTSIARVLVQTDQLGAPSFLSGITPYRDSQIPEAANRRLETEMALIASQSHAVEVVRALNVSGSQLSSTPMSQGKRWLAERMPSAMREWLAGPESRHRVSTLSEAATTETLLANLAVEPVRSKTAETTSNVVEVKMKTVDPLLAPRLLQALLDAYLRSTGGKSQQVGATTTALLDRQLADATTQLEGLEAEFVRLSNRSSSRSDGSVPTASAARGAEAARASADGAVGSLTTQVIDLQAKYEEQRVTFTDDAPVVRALRDRLATARARLQSTIRTNAADSFEFGRLERQRSVVQERYLELRRKRDQITLFTQLNPTSMEGREVVDPPSRPNEASAGRSKLPLVLGPVAGLALGLLIAALRELMNQQLRSSRDVERALGLSTIGALPRLERKRILAVRVATLSRPELRALSRS